MQNFFAKKEQVGTENGIRAVDTDASEQEIIVASLKEIIEERRQEIIVHSLRADFCGRTS